MSSGGRFSESIILTIASRKQILRKRYPWDCLLEVGYACLFIESLSVDRVGAYCIRLTKRYQRWRGMSRFRSLRGCGVGRIQYAPTIGYVRSFEISMRFSNRVRMILQKAVPFSSPTGPSVGRIRYAPTTRYVRSFEIPMQFPNRVHAILRNTDAIFQLDTCGHSKNCPVFVPFGAVCGAYTIRPYNRLRTTLRNTDTISQPGTYGPSKNCLVSVPLGAAGWGVFDTPL